MQAGPLGSTRKRLAASMLAVVALACAPAKQRVSDAAPSGPTTRPDDAVLVQQEEDAARQRAEREAIEALVDGYRRNLDASWREHFAAVVYYEAQALDLDPLMVAAIIARESSFRPRVVSSAGAVGLMQLRPFVAQDVAARTGVDWSGVETLHRPDLNVRLGARYFRELIDRFEGDTRLALAAYNRGPTRLRRQLSRGAEFQCGYADTVLELYRDLDRRRTDLLASNDANVADAPAT